MNHQQYQPMPDILPLHLLFSIDLYQYQNELSLLHSSIFLPIIELLIENRFLDDKWRRLKGKCVRFTLNDAKRQSLLLSISQVSSDKCLSDCLSHSHHSSVLPNLLLPSPSSILQPQLIYSYPSHDHGFNPQSLISIHYLFLFRIHRNRTTYRC